MRNRRSALDRARDDEHAVRVVGTARNRCSEIVVAMNDLGERLEVGRGLVHLERDRDPSLLREDEVDLDVVDGA